MAETIGLAVAFFAVAILYSAVGHAGASGYLAVMALVGIAPEEMKPTALVLNIFVASIGTYHFARAGHFSWGTLWPFLVGAFPMAFVGGRWQLPGYVYNPLVGIVLLVASFNLIWKWFRRAKSAPDDARAPSTPPLSLAVLVGAGVGLLAGLTGTGGGIFLSPLLILCGWADPKRTAAVTVVFVLLNSLSGLAGHFSGLQHLPQEIPVYLGAAIAGGVIGSGLGAKRLPGDGIRALLGVVLIVASIKMFIVGYSDWRWRDAPRREETPSEPRPAENCSAMGNGTDA